jgi:phosphoribosyl-AMP cyclohydrolase
MSGWTIQQALVRALSNSGAVTALCSRIVDYGPRVDDASTIYPYIAIGDMILSEFDTDDTNGFDAVFRIHIYSDQGGSMETRKIQDAIYYTLHRRELWVTGECNYLLYRMDTQVMQTSRGAFHGVDEYRALFDAS